MRKTVMFVLPLIFLMTFTLLTPALAKSPTITTGTAYGKSYTQIQGTLGDADYVIQIPDLWNGMLVVACPWYQFPKDGSEVVSHLKYSAISSVLVSQGYAFACSNYGATGFPIQEAMIRIHQLTEYVIDNYHVPGKVFVMGGSMGGAVAILLGEKYPELYSGVLDLCGAKNIANSYTLCMTVSTLSIAQLRVVLGLPSSMPDAQVAGLKAFFLSFATDVAIETGGTPETKPQAYAKIEPMLKTDLEIPIISIYGALDILCTPSLIAAYHNALDAAGTADLHRFYIVPNGGHITPEIFMEVPGRLAELVTWSDSLN